jgi:hypothetical protein
MNFPVLKKIAMKIINDFLKSKLICAFPFLSSFNKNLYGFRDL